MGRFPSGQREQTVNLPSQTSVVRIHPAHQKPFSPPEKASCGMAELADALDSGSSEGFLHAGSSPVSHQLKNHPNVFPRGNCVRMIFSVVKLPISPSLSLRRSHGCQTANICAKLLNRRKGKRRSGGFLCETETETFDKSHRSLCFGSRNSAGFPRQSPWSTGFRKWPAERDTK